MGAKLANARGGRRGEIAPHAEPNVIPFIDILLVLLIIFMVAAPIPTVDIRVDLPTPSAAAAPEQRRERTMVEIMDAAGAMALRVDGQETEYAALADAVLQRAQINNAGLSDQQIFADARVVVKADPNTEYGNVVHVMGRLKQKGFLKVALLFEPVGGP